jgi:hypothetical protein
MEVIDYSHVPEALISGKMPQVHAGLDLGWSQGGTKIKFAAPKGNYHAVAQLRY